MKKLAYIFALLIALPAVFATDLSTYPTFLSHVDLVVGDTAPAADVVSLVMIANALNAQGITTTAMLASEVASIDRDMISVGQNAVTSLMLATDTYQVVNGSARIKLIDHATYTNIVVYGNTADDTRKAAHVLANYASFPRETADIIVSGIIPNLTLSRIVPHLDYSCGGTQAFNPDGSWPMPCVGTALIQYFPAPVSGGSGSTGGTGTGGTGTGGTGTGGTGGTGTGGTGTGGTGTGGTGTGGTGGTGTGGTGTTITPGAALTLSSIPLFGDDDQNRGKNVSVQATLTNTGTVTLNGFTFSGLGSKYGLTATNVPASMTSGQSAVITLTALVPYDLDAVDSSCEEEPQSIGTVTVGSAQGATASQAAQMQAVNELAILDVFTVIAGEKQKVLETKLVDIYREDEVDLIVELKNRFTDDEDLEGQSQEIEAELKITGDTKEIDLDDSGDVSIDADSEDEVTISGRVEDNANGNIKLVIDALGRDEEGALHCDRTVVKFNTIEGVRSAIRPANGNTQTPPKAPAFTPFPEEKKATTAPPAAAPQEPREERVERTPVAAVSTSFRDSKAYSAMLLGLIVLMLAVVAAEVAVIIQKRNPPKKDEPLQFETDGYATD